jgi:hypothetical protein
MARTDGSGAENGSKPEFSGQADVAEREPGASGQIQLHNIDGWWKIAAVLREHPPIAA